MVVSNYELDQNNYQNIRFQGLLTFNKDLGKDFNLNATAGGEVYKNLGGNFSKAYTNSGLTIPGIYTIANSQDPATYMLMILITALPQLFVLKY